MAAAAGISKTSVHRWLQICVDKDIGLIHVVESTAANVHDLTPAAELLHGKE